MTIREIPDCFAPASLCLALLVCLVALPATVSAKSRAERALDSDYLPAVAAADHVLQAWQNGDAENGMVLLSSHAKEAATADGVDRFFSNAGPCGYEVGRGKVLKRGRYEFPVVLVSISDQGHHLRRHFSSIIVVNTGNNEWAVDKLP